MESYNIAQICTLAHTRDNVIERLHTVEFRNFLEAFRVVAACVMFGFVIRSGDAPGGPWLSMISLMSKSVPENFSGSPSARSNRWWSFELVADAPITQGGMNDDRPDDTV